MKKLAILFLALCFYVSANAQIQTKFWGLELSKPYTSIEGAQGIMDDRCEYSFIDNNSILAGKGTFGGYEWNHVSFQFHKKNLYWFLYKIAFSSHHTTITYAIDKYSFLLESLKVKYGEPTFHNMDEGVVVIWNDANNSHGCSLSWTKSESKGGEVFYYVDLEYYNVDYLREVYQQGKNEL